MSTPIIEVADLVKDFGSGVRAVDGISFTVNEGDFFGFLGPNGAGKTTSMRILATLLRKTSGRVMVAGFDVDTQSQGVRQAIGFAMQDISLDNLATGLENLQLLGVLYGLTRKESRARADELLEMVGLTKVADRWVNNYSGGMRRRLDLAGVLMHRPRLLFLDEPTQGLDPQARRVIWDYLRDLNGQGSTIFLTTHFMDEADVLCRDVAFIDKGQIVRRGTPEELKDEMGGDVITLQFVSSTDMTVVKNTLQKVIGPQDSIEEGSAEKTEDHEVLLTSRQANELVPRIINQLDAAGVAPQSLRTCQPSLEDVFVKLVGHSILDDAAGLVTGTDPFVQGRR